MTDLLFLAHRIPYPPNKGDKLRSYHLLRTLSEKFRVHLGCFIDDPNDWQHVGQVRGYCAETCFVPLNRRWQTVRSLMCLVTGEALSIGYYRHGGLQAWVNDIIARSSLSHVLVYSSVMAQFVQRIVGARRVADMVDVDSVKWSQYAKCSRWPAAWIYEREAGKLLRFESEVARSFDATVFVSQAEARLFRSLSAVPHNRIHWAPNGVDTEYFKPRLGSTSPYDTQTRVIVFTGAMDYRPNIDAVSWFADEVYPEVRSKWPDVSFAIVGANPTKTVRSLEAREGIIVTGTVADVRPFVEHAVASVAPLRIARGVQNKVLEGMAMGRTVIASTQAAEGLDVVAGRDVIVADNREDFVAAIDLVLRGKCELGVNARNRVLQSYSWPQNIARIRALLEPRP